MRKLIFYSSLLLLLQSAGMHLSAQNQASFELGSGLKFSLNEGAYQFKMGGMIQPYLGLARTNSQQLDKSLNVKRTYFNISGTAIKEKVRFFLQTDFSQGTPLMDAWLAFEPIKDLSITIGQKQSIANNREMLLMEDKLQFADRSLLSTSFCLTGREIGLFVEKKINFLNIGIVPQIAVTSGDGRNSFGIDSRDVDLGGLKYSGRMDLYPLGYFTKGNEDLVADLFHEKTLKMVIGGAASYNTGASHSVGEGHGDFQLYDVNGLVKLPDYRKIYGDILLKYQGFSFLGEAVISSATTLDGSYTTSSNASPLIPTQISEYLALGTAYNAQIGYVSKNGYALDLRYDALMPEFATNPSSLISKTTGLTVGFSKYFKQNDLKMQATVSSFTYSDNSNELLGSLILQVVF